MPISCTFERIDAEKETSSDPCIFPSPHLSIYSFTQLLIILLFIRLCVQVFSSLLLGFFAIIILFFLLSFFFLAYFLFIDHARPRHPSPQLPNSFRYLSPLSLLYSYFILALKQHVLRNFFFFFRFS